MEVSLGLRGTRAGWVCTYRPTGTYTIMAARGTTIILAWRERLGDVIDDSVLHLPDRALRGHNPSQILRLGRCMPCESDPHFGIL